jgi:hypothetical protein
MNKISFLLLGSAIGLGKNVVKNLQGKLIKVVDWIWLFDDEGNRAPRSGNW